MVFCLRQFNDNSNHRNKCSVPGHKTITVLIQLHSNIQSLGSKLYVPSMETCILSFCINIIYTKINCHGNWKVTCVCVWCTIDDLACTDCILSCSSISLVSLFLFTFCDLLTLRINKMHVILFRSQNQNTKDGYKLLMLLHQIL